MSGRVFSRASARARLASGAAALALAQPLFAQSTEPNPVQQAGGQVPNSADLDPSAPLAPLPGLGVDWPDLNSLEKTAIPPEAAAPAGKGDKAPAKISDSVGLRRYAIVLEGIDALPDAETIREGFRKRSVLQDDRKKGANVAQITRRAQSDSDLLAQLLVSNGYYDATVEPRIEGSGDALSVVLAAEPGQPYTFASVSLPGLESAGPDDAARLRETFAVQAGDRVVAENVIAAGTALTRALGEDGFANASIGEQQVVINHETHEATLVLPVDPGPVASFGTISVKGLPPFDAKHLGVIARFKRGDQYRKSRLDDLRRALIATGLIANAKITPVPIDGGRIINVDVALEEAPSHTIAGEVGYGTGQGPRIEGSWTDRNFFNPEGALTVRGVLGTTEQLAAVALRRSNFRLRDQILNVQALVAHQKFDAYTARTVALSAGIERQSNFIWQKKWTWTAGTQFLATDERGDFDPSGIKDTRTFLIAALPGSLGYDGSNSLLDPSRGFRLSGFLSPEVSFHNGTFTYARTQIDASAYHPVGDRVVVAGRVRFGTILGSSVYDIAPSRRFYAGGGGSVRGYGYQRLGPKDLEGDPVGGRGLAEFALEARIRLKQFGGNFGVVPFVDGGTLTTKAMPDFSAFKLAVGIGLRYYSSFGPIRIDLGVPLNREQGDGPVAVAVSLGQAF